MRKPDDCSLTVGQRTKVRAEAERALLEAGALGVFPTPVDRILAVAKVKEVQEDVLNPSFLAKIRAETSGVIKSALSKVLGLFHAKDGLIFIDRTVNKFRQTFIRLHEAGHGFMPWQRGMYALVEDCEHALDSDTAALFDREAGVFASEVLFQLDTFIEDSRSRDFSIWTPVKMSKEYGASIYAAVRQYVAKNDRVCAVLVLNMPELVPGDGYRATLRRPIESDAFRRKFGTRLWRDVYTPDHDIGALVPIGGRKYSGKKSLALTDLNGERHEFVAEAFTQGHHVFVLMQAVATLSATRIILPAAV